MLPIYTGFRTRPIDLVHAVVGLSDSDSEHRGSHGGSAGESHTDTPAAHTMNRHTENPPQVNS